MDRAVVNRIWLSTTQKIAENTAGSLQDLLDATLQNFKNPLSAPATHAAQTVRQLVCPRSLDSLTSSLATVEKC